MLQLKIGKLLNQLLMSLQLVIILLHAVVLGSKQQVHIHLLICLIVIQKVALKSIGSKLKYGICLPVANLVI